MNILLLMVLLACVISLRGWYSERCKVDGRKISLLGHYRRTPKKQRRALQILVLLGILAIVAFVLMALGY